MQLIEQCKNKTINDFVFLNGLIQLLDDHRIWKNIKEKILKKQRLKHN